MWRRQCSNFVKVHSAKASHLPGVLESDALVDGCGGLEAVCRDEAACRASLIGCQPEISGPCHQLEQRQKLQPQTQRRAQNSPPRKRFTPKDSVFRKTIRSVSPTCRRAMINLQGKTTLASMHRVQQCNLQQTSLLPPWHTTPECKKIARCIYSMHQASVQCHFKQLACWPLL